MCCINPSYRSPHQKNNTHIHTCSHGSCVRYPSFNNQTPANCRQHPGEGVVSIRPSVAQTIPARGYLVLTWKVTRRPCAVSNMLRTALWTSLPAAAHMTPTIRSRPSNVEGWKGVAFCKEHADYGIANVARRHCTYDSCVKPSRWGLLVDGASTACPRHKGNLASGKGINVKASCDVASCSKLSR